MNPEVKRRWLEALRSGEYKQGKLRLKTSNNEFCCLGVLCDLYAKEKGIEWDMNDSFMGENSYLSQDVIDWSGVGFFNPTVKAIAQRSAVSDSYDGLDSLGNMNDAGIGFDIIAKTIEEQL